MAWAGLDGKDRKARPLVICRPMLLRFVVQHALRLAGAMSQSSCSPACSIFPVRVMRVWHCSWREQRRQPVDCARRRGEYNVELPIDRCCKRLSDVSHMGMPRSTVANNKKHKHASRKKTGTRNKVAAPPRCNLSVELLNVNVLYLNRVRPSVTDRWCDVVCPCA